MRDESHFVEVTVPDAKSGTGRDKAIEQLLYGLVSTGARAAEEMLFLGACYRAGRDAPVDLILVGQIFSSGNLFPQPSDDESSRSWANSD